MMMKNVLRTIELMRAAEPEEPIYAILHVPAAVAFTLMGAKPAFKAMIKNRNFSVPCAIMWKMPWWNLQDAGRCGIGFLWFPMPNFGGYCISRKSYEKCISQSNIRANKRIKDYGASIVIHTCGLYDDRFDWYLRNPAMHGISPIRRPRR